MVKSTKSELNPPEDALQAFERMRLDALAIDDFIVEKYPDE